MQEAKAQLGVIEGYYGKPWSWSDRAAQVTALKPHGYGFFTYAPKADPYLRKRWREPHPAETQAELAKFGAHCAAEGVRFGVGLSPYELWLDFGPEAKAALTDKLAALDAAGVRDLAILFDDMRGDVDGLARMQTDIVHWIAERTRADRLIFCPTYYSDDILLEVVFGKAPAGYLEELGRGLDPRIEMFWTGEEVCSPAYSPGHLDRVAEAMRRKPFLWDNYPVNDGPRMSPFLHLRGMTGRPASLAPRLAAHAVNPALQPILTRIPMITQAMAYAEGDAYEYSRATRAAAHQVLGEELGDLIVRNLLWLQDIGREKLEPAAEARLRARFSEHDHPGAREIIAWLDGYWRVTREDFDGA